MSTSETAGFWSYARQDDEQDGGRIRKLAEAVKNAYSLRTGEELELFIDRDVHWGEEWRARIDQELSGPPSSSPSLLPATSSGRSADANC